MQSNLEPILNNLSKAQAGLLSAADSIMVERTIVASADRIAQKQPKAVPLLRRFPLPMALVEARLIKRKSPIAVDCQLIGEKEEMLAE